MTATGSATFSRPVYTGIGQTRVLARRFIEPVLKSYDQRGGPK
jgi:hypothetical protein